MFFCEVNDLLITGCADFTQRLDNRIFAVSCILSVIIICTELLYTMTILVFNKDIVFKFTHTFCHSIIRTALFYCRILVIIFKKCLTN